MRSNVKSCSLRCVEKNTKHIKQVKSIKLSASGKLVISGEHAIMHGYCALSMAINQRMFVKITPCYGHEIVEIKSNLFGKKLFNRNDVQNDWSEMISFLVKKLSYCGLKISIKSKIKNYGFGSSGALFVCIAYGLLKIDDIYLGKQFADDEKYFAKILDLYREFNFKHKYSYIFSPSGIDIATSFFGGLIYFNPTNLVVEKISTAIFDDGITAIYSGKKTLISDVELAINRVKNANKIYQKIGDIVEKMKFAICNKDNDIIDNLVRKNQELLRKLNLVNKDIDDIMHKCERKNVVAKISGSGLGDCVITLRKGVKVGGYKSIAIKPEHRGITCNVKYR